MPDWSYHTTFKPALFALPAKIGRDITFRALNILEKMPFGSKLIAFMGHMEPSPEIEISMFGLNFLSPVGLQARIDPQCVALGAMMQFGFGFVSIGPVTRQPILEGHVVRDDMHEEIGYAQVDANAGLEEIVRKLSTLPTHGCKRMIRVRYVAGDRHALGVLMDRLWTVADGFVIEGLSPTDGPLLNTLKNTYSPTPVLIGMSLYETDPIPYVKMQPAGIVLDEARIHAGTAYFGGRESKQHGLSLLQRIRRIDSTVPIVAAGGITAPCDALQWLDAGANLVQVHSGFVYSGPGLPKRIGEALTQRIRIVQTAAVTTWGWFFLMGLGIGIAGMVAVFFGLTTVISPYDEAFLGITHERLSTYHETLFHFMSHDRNTLAGVLLSAAILYMQLAYHGVRHRVHWARKAYILAGTLGFLNFFYFIGFGYFDALHFFYLLILLPFFLIGIRQTRKMQRGESGTNVRNHRVWRRGLIGQLCFVAMGGLLFIGGIVISLIGMTTLFVSADLAFIGLNREEIHAINARLLSLIAHDRAGLGGALLSEGLLILCIALWGFREGERWIWWTLFLGGIPGFLAVLGTHFHIGYTDFFHLLPAYFLFFLYGIGLFCSYAYLHHRGARCTTDAVRDPEGAFDPSSLHRKGGKGL